MNRTFKTLWNDVRRCYIVANEAQKSRGKSSKSAVAVAVAATALLSAGAASAYVEPGVIGDQTSWETAEYEKDWGLRAMNASKAYSLGFNGQNTKVAVMDSGALLSHPQLSGDRFSGTVVKGEYGSTGNRYPQSVSATNPGQPYEKGEKFEVTGDWMTGVNDTHGTHVTGTVGAHRDGSEFHGVAWGADIVVGNTGATDNNNYGPFQDHDYFYAGWKALADDVVAANGADRGGVINNSWGTNIRVQNLQVKNASGRWTTVGLLKAGETIESLGYTADEARLQQTHIPTNTIAQAEWEYFYSNKLYNDKFVAGMATSNKSFVDAAYEAVAGTNVVQIFTTGNRDMANPFYRPLYPYFHPDAEKHWIAVAGAQKDNATGGYKLYASFNEAGLGKYWTVVAPGSGIYSSNVTQDPNTGEGIPGYQSSSGTSMSAPHVAGAMGVLMSRYQDMSAIQVRDVMFTTANHKNPDGSNMNGWDNVDGTTPAEGEVSDRMGWGMPDLDKGMYGPGQLLGKFDYNMATTGLDVWTNDISQVALEQRKREELAWMEKTENGTKVDADEFELGNSFVVADGDDDNANHVVAQADAEKWRLEYYAERAAMIQAKIDGGLYDGSLVKRGEGTLVMTGNNTYEGGTTVEGGKLFGFTESFGSGPVVVNGGQFGVLATYNDEFTQKGELTSLYGGGTAVVAQGNKADIEVNAGGTYVVVADQDVVVNSLKFNEGAAVTVGSVDKDVAQEVLAGNVQTGSVTAEAGITGEYVVTPDYALLKADVALEGNTLTATLAKNEDATFAGYGENANASAVGAILDASDSELRNGLLTATKSEMTEALSSLGNELHVASQSAAILNSMSIARAVKDQAVGVGEGRRAEMADGTARIWATGVGSWGEVKYGNDADTDMQAALVGAEVDVVENTKLGVYFGAGTSKVDGVGKVESDDLHFGIYGQTNFEKLSVAYGIAHTSQDRDSSRAIMGAGTIANFDADMTQVFGEIAYTGLDTDAYSIEPYFGMTYMKAKADKVAEGAFETKLEDQNIFMTSLGVRGAVPFTLGSVAIQAKADVAWHHFMGDNQTEAVFKLADAGDVMLKGEKLANMGTVGFAFEAQLNKSTTLGVRYTGAFGDDINSHGVGANLRINF